MAFTDVVPVTMNPAVTQGLAQDYNSPNVVNSAGVNVNLSAWVSMTAKLAPATANPTGADITLGTVTGGSTGIVNLKLSTADTASLAAGTARLVISGKPTSGDDAQLLCSGTLTVQQG